MEEAIKKSMLSIAEILNEVVFEDPVEWSKSKREARRNGSEPPIPGDGTGWLAPTIWQVEEAIENDLEENIEEEIRYNAETNEIELAMRHVNACSCCADNPCYLKWLTIPELIAKLKEKYWIALETEDSAITSKLIRKLEKFYKEFKVNN